MTITLQQWMAELARETARVNAEAHRVVSRATDRVVADARKNARRTSGKAARQYPATITGETKNMGARITGEIGPERRGQGHLGPILENGSINNPPHRDLGRALDDEEPRFISSMSQIGPVR